MKNVRRVLSSVIAFAVLVSCMAFSVSAASFPDVPDGHANKAAIEQLSDLGIIQGDDQGNFNPDNNVNRAEFTALVMRFIGQSGSLGTVSAENAPFPDLSDSSVSWAIGDITIARNMGIINGYEDGTFRPTDPVAFEEAVKMIVCALGYGKSIVPAADAAQWFQPYMAIATDMGFTKRAGGSIGVAATRGCIAQMLYDAKDVKTVDANGKVSDKSVLQDKLGSTKASGIIVSDRNTSLMAPDSRVKDNEVQILTREDGVDTLYTYTTSNSAYRDWIGYQVDLYYTEDNSDDTRILSSATKKGTKEETVDAKDIIIEDSTATSISYYPSETAKARSLSISSDNVVIYNDKLYGSNADNSAFDPSMLPVVGKVTLIDTKGDGGYDVIKIESYDVYTVTSRTETDHKITDNTSGTDRQLVLDVDDTSIALSIVDTAGKEVKFSSIVARGNGRGSVVCYKESRRDNGGDILATAVVNTTTKSGEVMSVKESEIRIGDTTYDVSPAAPWRLYKNESNALKAPSIGDNAAFYFDMNGAVVSYDKTAVVTNQQYGYIISAASASDLDDNALRVRILTANNGVQTYETQKNTRLAGESYSSASALESALREYVPKQNTDLPENSRTGIYQFVKFTTKTSNRKTVLDEIVPVTEFDKAPVVSSDVLARLTTVDATMSMRYNSNTKQLKEVDGSRSVTLGSNTKIFSVPENRGNNNEYKTLSLSAMKNNQLYRLEVFDVSNLGTAAAVVVYGVDATTAVDAQTPVFVITEIDTTTNDKEGISMVRLTGYQAGISGSAKENTQIWVSPESELKNDSDLHIGDIIRCGSDKDGYATIAAKDVLWSMDMYGVAGDIKHDDTTGKTDWQETEFTAINAAVVAYDDANDAIGFSPSLIADKSDERPEDTEVLSASKFSSATFLQYEFDRNEVSKINKMTDKGSDALKGIGEGRQIFIYMSKGNVKLVVSQDVKN